jgi:hypothetical protein
MPQLEWKEILYQLMDAKERTRISHAARKRQEWIARMAEEGVFRGYLLGLEHATKNAVNIPEITRYVEEFWRKQDQLYDHPKTSHDTPSK